MTNRLTPEQFDALQELGRIRPNSARYAIARSVFVDGLSTADAARLHGASYNAAHQAVAAASKKLALCRIVAGA